MPSLFDPARFGDLQLANGVVMAPLTRDRAGPGGVPTALMAAYYAQRAGAGMIVSEGTQIVPEGQGYLDTPGIHSAAQADGWRVREPGREARGRAHVQPPLDAIRADQVQRVPAIVVEGVAPAVPVEISAAPGVGRPPADALGRGRRLSREVIVESVGGASIRRRRSWRSSTSCSTPATRCRTAARSLIDIRNRSIDAGDNGFGEIEAGDYVSVTITDEGVGMTPEVLARAGEPFFSTRAPGAGRGLGPFLSRAIVEHLGGRLGLEWAPGAGTRAVLEVPCDPLARGSS